MVNPVLVLVTNNVSELEVLCYNTVPGSSQLPNDFNLISADPVPVVKEGGNQGSVKILKQF